MPRRSSISARMKIGRRLARRIAARLAPHVRHGKIVLFGSYAYGRPGPDSDIDVLVVTACRENALDRAVFLDELVAERSIGLDLVVLKPGEVRKRLREFDPFLEEVLARGLILHESAR